MAAAPARSGLVGALAAWLTSLLLGMVGIGLVLPSGPEQPAEESSRLVGARTGDVLVLPTLKVRAPLVSVAMDARKTLTPPRDPHEVGWWDRSADPGSTTGQTLVTGHTVHTGGGALDRLGTLHRGDSVSLVKTTDGRTRTTAYRVTAVRTYSKPELARRASELFGQRGGDGRLVLVTCTGWDGREYHGNVVVLAERLRTISA